MPRGAVSRADQELIAALRALRLKVSPYQLERWRQNGLVPKNIRRSLGRGRGTTSELAPDALACAVTVASAMDPKPPSVLAHITLALLGRFNDTYDIASRPLRTSVAALITESDLLDLDEDVAYARAADMSSPRHASFSPARGHPSLNKVSDVIAHKRNVHQHFLVASYLGVPAVGRGLLGQTLLELGYAHDDSVDMLLDFLEVTFTPATDRHVIVNSVDTTELAYLLCAANFILDIPQTNRWFHVPATNPQQARFKHSPVRSLALLRSFPGSINLAAVIFLIADTAFHREVHDILGEDWEGETRHRIVTTQFGVQVKPLEAHQRAAQEARRRQWLHDNAEQFSPTDQILNQLLNAHFGD